MNKRGQGFSITTIIMVVLGLLALVIVIILFRQQVTKGASQYEQIGQGTGLEADRCFNLIEGRSCVEGRNCPEGMEPVSGRWKDCEGTCCKKTEP